MSSADFLIMGAGPAGLAAAHLLAGRGFEVLVLERADQVGGLAGSFEVAGQRVDHGSHRLHATTQEPALALLRSLLGDGLQRRTRHGRIRLNGRWLRFPLSPLDLFRGMSPGMIARAGGSAALASLRPQRDRTFEEYVRTGLGGTVGEAFYFPYARKIWGVEPNQLSGGQARKRISADSPWKVLRRVVAAKDDARRSFFYPTRGFGAIPEALAESAVEQGATVRLGAEVTHLDLAADRVTATTAGGEEYSGAQLWSTIPVSRLAQLAGRADPTHLEYRAMALVYLVVPTDRYTEFDAHYFPEVKVPMTRISEPKNYRDGDDPDDITVLCAEIPCAVGDEIWSASDADLGARVAAALEASGLPSIRLVDTVVRRLRFAYPIYTLGYEAALDAVLDWASQQSALLTLGRQGLFAHDNTHHALAMAWAAADAVGSDGHFDEQAWARALVGFQGHVVED